MAKGSKNSERNKKNRFLILSIDGGGIRGIIPAAILVRLEELIREKRQDNGSIGDYFDFIAGTSTGGILTCLYLAPEKDNPCKARYNAVQVKNFYLDHGEEIFDRSIWQKIKTTGGLTDEKYSARELDRHLKEKLGKLELKDLIKPCLITGYDVRQYRPVFYTKQDADVDETNYRLRDVARATAAAPTYFEAALPESLNDIPDETPVIDGGVFANNPTACALVEAIKKGHGKDAAGNEIGVPMEDIAILSLGTGSKPETITYDECKDWGVIGWARPILGIMMEGSSQTVDYQMQCIFKIMGKSEDYLRINGEFGDFKQGLDIPGLDPAMDSASNENMDRLLTFGSKLAENYDQQLKDFVNRFF